MNAQLTRVIYCMSNIVQLQLRKKKNRTRKRSVLAHGRGAVYKFSMYTIADNSKRDFGVEGFKRGSAALWRCGNVGANL